MRSLFLSDLYNVSTIFKQIAFAILILSVSFLYSMGAGGYIIFCTCLCGVTCVNLFAMDEKAKWLKYAMIMPVSKKEYICSKYIITGLFITGGLTVSVLVTFLASTFELTEHIPTKDILMYMLSGVGAGIIFVSLYIPIMVRYGTEKARFILIGVLMVPSLIGFALSSGDGAPTWFMSGLSRCVDIIKAREYILLVFVGAILAISISLSLKWIENKEF